MLADRSGPLARDPIGFAFFENQGADGEHMSHHVRLVVFHRSIPLSLYSNAQEHAEQLQRTGPGAVGIQSTAVGRGIYTLAGSVARSRTANSYLPKQRVASSNLVSRSTSCQIGTSPREQFREQCRFAFPPSDPDSPHQDARCGEALSRIAGAVRRGRDVRERSASNHLCRSCVTAATARLRFSSRLWA